MQAHDVLDVVDALTTAGVAVWLDGGWGVDALLGAQTRAHDDLDVVIALDEMAAAQEALRKVGFSVAEDEPPTRFVMRDAGNRSVDFHTVTFDDEGNGFQHLQDGSAFRYPAEGFAGVGRVGNRLVRCLTPATQALRHRGYEPDEKDRHDMRLLHERFGIDAPDYPYNG